ASARLPMQVHTHQLPGRSVRSQGASSQNGERAHEDRLLDEALAATFPCSDPISSLSVDDVIPDDEEQASPSASTKDSDARSRPVWLWRRRENQRPTRRRCLGVLWRLGSESNRRTRL